MSDLGRLHMTGVVSSAQCLQDEYLPRCRGYYDGYYRQILCCTIITAGGSHQTGGGWKQKIFVRGIIYVTYFCTDFHRMFQFCLRCQ